MMLAVLFAEKNLTELLLPAIVALIGFIVMFIVARKQSRPEPRIWTHEPDSPQPAQLEPASQPLDTSRAAVYSRSYETPLFLLLGPANSGQGAVLHALKTAFPENGHAAAPVPGLAHFERGVVLEVDGDLFAPPINGNGNSNGSNKDKEWKKFLDHLQKQRPQRPMDGVVLTLPGNQLVGKDALSSDQWQQRAAHMSKNLRLMRDRFGFSFPVYILVTKCHAIRGFREFAAAQLRANLREIFGWSNPYNLDAPFNPEWTEKAFSCVGQVVEEQRVQFFAQHQSSGNGHTSLLQDELFLFPVNFRELETPVAGLLENLFRDSGHHDALQFRGIYFSGHAGEAHEGTEGADYQHGNGHLAEFTADLFAEKVFPERGLAHPVDSKLAPKNRAVSGAKTLCWVVALLLFSGAAVAWHNLFKTQQKVLPPMERILTELQQRPETPQILPAYDAIYTAQVLSVSDFQSPFLPFSLGGDLDSKLQESMAPVFDKVVYPALHAELEHRTARLVKDAPVPEITLVENSGSTAQSPYQPENAPQRLSAFVNQLLPLEDNIVFFNSLAWPGAGNGKDMLTLESNISPFTFVNGPLAGNSTLDAIARSKSDHLFDGRPWNDLTVNRLEIMVTDALRQRLNEHELLDDLSAIMDQINLLEQNKLEDGKLDPYKELESLGKSMTKAQTELAAPELAWIAKDDSQLPPDIEQTLAPIFARTPEQNILLCDPKQEAQPCIGLHELKSFIEEAAHAHFLDFRAQLLADKTNTTGNLITVADGKLQLAPTAARLQSVLASFLTLPFVAHNGNREIQDVQPGQQLFWDNSKLQEALQDKAAYDKFFSDDLANTPSSLQDTVQDVALEGLETNMVDAIASAQQFQPLPEKAEQPTAAEARTFAAAEQPLTQLLEQFSELNLDEDYQDLLRASTGHALMVLARVDHYFDSRNFYFPPAGNFDHWSGATPPSTAGYNTHSLDNMLAYLTLQRQDLQSYIAQVQPLVTFLQQRSPKNQKQSALIAKWAGIVNDVQKYASAPAGSSLGSLENYLATEIDKTTPPECQAPAAPSGMVYFAQTQRSLERAVVARCRALSHQTGSVRYNQLAEFFNQHLKDRFPFSDPKAENPPEADPNDVVALFRLLDADSKAIHEALQNNANGNSSTATQMATFVSQIEALRPLFASLLSGQADQGPMWDFVPVFRTNRSHEINGNQIIDWTLAVDKNTFRNYDPPKTGQWSLGQPVTLTLRWAKDSPNRPISAAPAVNDPNSKTVVFEYRDPCPGTANSTCTASKKWALLSMLVQHAPSAGDFDRKLDPDPQTLAFTIGQQVVPDPAKERQSAPLPGNPAAGPDVKMFITIRLYQPGKTTALRLPVFPTQAPTE